MFELVIISVLDTNTPITRNNIRMQISAKLGRNVDWHTIDKYLQKLREKQEVEEVLAGKMKLYKKSLKQWLDESTRRGGFEYSRRRT